MLLSEAQAGVRVPRLREKDRRPQDELDTQDQTGPTERFGAAFDRDVVGAPGQVELIKRRIANRRLPSQSNDRAYGESELPLTPSLQLLSRPAVPMRQPLAALWKRVVVVYRGQDPHAQEDAGGRCAQRDDREHQQILTLQRL